MKVCLIGSQEPYPAFDSVLSILRDILGQSQVIDLRIRDYQLACPPLLRFFMCALQDLILYLKITIYYKREKVNVILIFQGYYPLSSIASKLLNIKLLLFIGGSSFHLSYHENITTVGRLLAYTNLLLQGTCHKFADVLITLSERMVNMIGLEKYEQKTRFTLPRLDKNFYKHFQTTKSYGERSNIVGFVGPICRNKGVLNLLHAIPLITEKSVHCKFVLIGIGPLLGTIETEVEKLGLSGSTNILRFIESDSLTKYYNDMKLLILPSYTEGIPSTIFEAMACGTPVLATPVGGIPDVIVDGETGFLLRSNDPKHIADRIAKLLNDHELLKKASANASNYIMENFSEDRVLESWRRIFQEIRLR